APPSEFSDRPEPVAGTGLATGENRTRISGAERFESLEMLQDCVGNFLERKLDVRGFPAREHLARHPLREQPARFFAERRERGGGERPADRLVVAAELEEQVAELFQRRVERHAGNAPSRAVRPLSLQRAAEDGPVVFPRQAGG